MDDSKSNKRQVEAQREGESSAKRQTVTMRLETLDCSVCSQPLKPQIFQCSVGHFICSSCLRLVDKKCHLCSTETSFNRCFGMECVVQSVTVACSNAKHGCTSKTTYYQKEKHEKECLDAPCFCPESGCSFAGAARALMHHFTTQHKCRLTTFDDSNLVNVYLDLQPGLHVLHCCEDSRFFLFNMASEPFGHAISVFCVQPKATEPNFTCDLYYDSFTTDDSQSCCFKIRSSSLSDGLPTGYDLIVPKGKVSDEGNGIMTRVKCKVRGEENDIFMIRATIRGKRKVFNDSDSDDRPCCRSKLIPDYSDSDEERPLCARLSTVRGTRKV